VSDAARRARRAIQGFITSIQHNRERHETSKTHVLEALRKHREALTSAVEDSTSEMTLDDVRRRVLDARMTFDGFSNDDDIIVLSIEDPIYPREEERRRYSRASAYAAEEEFDSDTPGPEYQEERDSRRSGKGKGKAKDSSSRLEEESEPTSRTVEEPESSRKGKEPESYSSRDPDPQPEIPQQSGGMFNWFTNASHQEIVDFLLDLGNSTNSSDMDQQRAILVEEITAPDENGYARNLSEEALDYYRVAVESLYTAFQSQSQGPDTASDETSYG
jgi:hypothetical protein